EGFSLLFSHCIGGHKELWEPVIEEIFRLQQVKASPQRVREAWAFDRQDHGDAAILNREALDGTQDIGIWVTPSPVDIDHIPVFSGTNGGTAIAAFVRSPSLQGRRTVAIGHSAASGAMQVTPSSSCSLK
ncbi:hypothetical protein DFH09DRAFT_928645, partial [Mycena vulgaris]